MGFPKSDDSMGFSPGTRPGTVPIPEKKPSRHSFFVSKIVWSYFKVFHGGILGGFMFLSLIKLGFSVELGVKRWLGSSRPPDKPSFGKLGKVLYS